MTGSGSTVRPPLVVGVEHNDAGRLAVEWAADQAERRGLPLHLVRALDWPAGAPRPQFTVAREPAPRHRESARAHATSWPTQVYRDAYMIP
ncbi:MAG: universal stress protein, partial [Streptomycetaceae bacterium]|nr:universal stress protein [Streptomycetaceae bacterium]